MNKHGGYKGQGDVIDFSVNINPLGLSKNLKEKLKKCVDKLDTYPEIDGISARILLAKHMALKVDNIIIGNGATELIYLFAKSYKAKKVLIVDPTFTEYKRAFELNKATVLNFKTKEQDNFEIIVEDLIREVEEKAPDCVVICNPNNPTGTFTEKKELEKLLKKLKSLNIALFLDESFIDFVEKDSALSLIEKYPLFILRSLTKTYAIPGLRLGYGVANKDIIDRLKAHKEPWTVNSLALEAVDLILKDQAYIKDTNEWYREEKQFLKENLIKIPYLKLYEAHANFFLCKLCGINAKSLRDYLIAEGIYIRTCEDFCGLDESYIRLAVKKRKENTILIEKLKRGV